VSNLVSFWSNKQGTRIICVLYLYWRIIKHSCLTIQRRRSGTRLVYIFLDRHISLSDNQFIFEWSPHVSWGTAGFSIWVNDFERIFDTCCWHMPEPSCAVPPKRWWHPHVSYNCAVSDELSHNKPAQPVHRRKWEPGIWSNNSNSITTKRNSSCCTQHTL